MTQIEYVDALFNDCGFNRVTRNAYMTRMFRRKIQFLDELSSRERSILIDELKEKKANLQGERGADKFVQSPRNTCWIDTTLGDDDVPF